LAGISLGHELYGYLDLPGSANRYNDPVNYPTLAPYAGDRVGQADALRALLEARYTEIKTVFPAAEFPNTYSVLLDGLWNDLLDYGPFGYYPPPRNVDVLGIDPYFAGGGPEVLLCDAATKAQWDAHVGGRVERALIRFPQPLMLVAQSFRHKNPEVNGWPYMPAPCQFEWWYQLAIEKAPRIPALEWFNYGYAKWAIPVGVRHPDHSAQLAKLIEIFDRNLANRP
jgi:hypothetical protein